MYWIILLNIVTVWYNIADDYYGDKKSKERPCTLISFSTAQYTVLRTKNADLQRLEQKCSRCIIALTSTRALISG